VNDSKATNVDSTLVALASFADMPVHLILGGGGKGQDFAPLREPAGRCAGVYLIGADGPLIGRQIGTGVECGDLATAVERARAAARPGDVVLLSPACESYDQFENNLLLTVTLCLLAAGAVMVYSASSAKTLLQGQGDGTTYLVRYVLYGAIGFAALHVLSRRGLAAITSFAGPLLAISFGLLVLVKLPGVGVSVNGARRWMGAGPLQFQPSELMKLALVLYAAGVIAQRPKIVKRPKQLVPIGVMVGFACILIASQ